jgi:hypothetical protein
MLRNGVHDMTKSAITAMLLAGTMIGTAYAGTIEVRPGQSIEEAINRARPGDTVAVRAGTYHETIYAKPNGVKLISVDGKGAAHIVSGGTPLFLQGGSGNEIRGFALTAGRGGNGIQVGGTVSDFAKGYVIADNIIKSAGEDGIKVHQASGFTFTGNVIENAGTGNGGNHDGGIDFVAVTDSRVEGNAVVRTGGNSCLMLKGGTARNTITGNSFSGCKDGVHVGGLTTDRFMAPGSNGKEAYGNTITGNSVCAASSPVLMFDGEQRRRDNTIGGNSCNGSMVGPIMAGWSGGGWMPPLDAEKVQNDIAIMRNSGTPPATIKYILGLDGIVIPDDVANGNKSVQDAIEDGTLKQESAPTTWTPPTMQPTPTPDLTPQGSSAGSWTPNTTIPAIESLRGQVMSRSRPPNC